MAYEQHIGRRQPGQRGDGTYEVSVSKTLAGDMDAALSWWLGKVADQPDFNGVKIEGDAKISKTEKWRTWRLKLADGTSLLASTNNKGADKALFVIAHQKLTSSQDAETWRSFWKRFLNS